MAYSIISANCRQGQRRHGVEFGPYYLKPLINNSKFHSTSTHEILLKKFDTIEGYKKLFDIHQRVQYNGDIPIVLGGDHSIGHMTVGSSVQTYGDNILVLWIDAHADINTYESSLSKNTHGTPLAGLIGLEPAWIPEIKTLLKPENLIYYGIRDLDKFETNVLKRYGIKSIPLPELSTIVEQFEHVHISFDVDSLSAEYLNSTGTIADNGIAPDDVIECFDIVGNKLKALDITEFNPQLGNLKKSLKTIDHILQKIK
jgi:arginase